MSTGSLRTSFRQTRKGVSRLLSLRNADESAVQCGEILSRASRSLHSAATLLQDGSVSTASEPVTSFGACGQSGRGPSAALKLSCQD